MKLSEFQDLLLRKTDGLLAKNEPIITILNCIKFDYKEFIELLKLSGGYDEFMSAMSDLVSIAREFRVND